MTRLLEGRALARKQALGNVANWCAGSASWSRKEGDPMVVLPTPGKEGNPVLIPM